MELKEFIAKTLSEIVEGVRNAEKDHSTPKCRWLENCLGQIKEVSLDVAEAQGKSPCKGCH